MEYFMTVWNNKEIKVWLNKKPSHGGYKFTISMPLYHYLDVYYNEDEDIYYGKYHG